MFNNFHAHWWYQTKIIWPHKSAIFSIYLAAAKSEQFQWDLRHEENSVTFPDSLFLFEKPKFNWYQRGNGDSAHMYATIEYLVAWQSLNETVQAAKMNMAVHTRKCDENSQIDIGWPSTEATRARRQCPICNQGHGVIFFLFLLRHKKLKIKDMAICKIGNWLDKFKCHRKFRSDNGAKRL